MKPVFPPPVQAGSVRRALLVPAVLLLAACAFFPSEGGERRARPDIPSLFLAPDAPRYLVCGHRGDVFGSFFVDPSNTIPSLARAVRAGADLLEIDVRERADGVPVVAHGGGGVEEAPLLADVLRWAGGRVVLVLDLKPGKVAPVVRVVRDAGAVERVVFFASNDDEFARLRRQGADLYLMVRARKPSDLRRWLRLPDPRLLLVHGDPDWLTPGRVARIHRRGRRVFANAWEESFLFEVFGAGPAARELFSRGIDVVQTNSPATAAWARDQMGPDPGEEERGAR